MRSVRRGTPHPDPAVWLAAVDWARAELRRPVWQVVVAPFLLDPMAWAERRAASRITKVHQHG